MFSPILFPTTLISLFVLLSTSSQSAFAQNRPVSPNSTEASTVRGAEARGSAALLGPVVGLEAEAQQSQRTRVIETQPGQEFRLSETKTDQPLSGLKLPEGMAIRGSSLGGLVLDTEL